MNFTIKYESAIAKINSLKERATKNTKVPEDQKQMMIFELNEILMYLTVVDYKAMDATGAEGMTAENIRNLELAFEELERTVLVMEAGVDGDDYTIDIKS